MTMTAEPQVNYGLSEEHEALRASGLPQVSNVGEKGGSAVASAALNALLYSTPVTRDSTAVTRAGDTGAARPSEETR